MRPGTRLRLVLLTFGLGPLRRTRMIAGFEWADDEAAAHAAAARLQPAPFV